MGNTTAAVTPQYVGASFYDGPEDSASHADFVRSLVNGGRAVGVVMLAKTLNEAHAAAPPETPASPIERCTSGDHAGRWIAVPAGMSCKPPMCSGDVKSPRVDLKSKATAKSTWLWVPHNCYYHIFSDSNVKACAASRSPQLQWLHTMGDLQMRSFVTKLIALAKVDSLQDTTLPSVSFSEVSPRT